MDRTSYWPIVFFAAVVLIYFIPNWIASGRQHPNKNAIFVANLLLGWTILGWIGTLVWSFTSTKSDATVKSVTATDGKGDGKSCPSCAETIKRAAVKCRYCGGDVPRTEQHG